MDAGYCRSNGYTAALCFFSVVVGSFWCEVHLLVLFEGGAAANMVAGAVEMEKRGDDGARCLAVVGNGDGCHGGSWWRLGFEEN